MANLASIGAELLRSGDYTDLTLVCEGQEFRVHKNIVCLQSPVIAAALKSEFKEAKTNTIEVNFELATLKCMLDYMYTGHYKEPVQPAQPSQSAQTAQPAQPSSTSRIGCQPGTKPTDKTISQELIYHLRVNSIADYYNVMGLAEISVTKIQKLLNERWSADAFCNLIREATGSTGDKNLQEILARTAASKVFELVRKDIFAEGKIANDMAAQVLKASIKIYNDNISQVNKLKNQIEVEKAKTVSIEKELNDLADVLSATRTCCKRECKHPFGCVIQRPTQNTEKRWFVRCTKCSCRHVYDKKTDSAILAPPPPFDYSDRF